MTTEATLEDYMSGEYHPVTHEDEGTVVHRWWHDNHATSAVSYLSVCGAPTEWVKVLPEDSDVFCHECWHGEWATEEELPLTKPLDKSGTIDYNEWMSHVQAESSPIRKVQ